MARKRWSMEQDTRQRFNKLIKKTVRGKRVWTKEALAAATGLSLGFIESYAKNQGVDHGTRKTQAIWDLYEDEMK